MTTLQLDAGPFEYVLRGQGEPVVLVHGTLGDYRSWAMQVDVFAESYRTIAYSRRYHYPNPCRRVETDYSAALHADDLADLIAGLGLESAHIVGTSYGAYTALVLAARHPHRVRRLVLGDPPILPLLDSTSRGRQLHEEFLTEVWRPAGRMMQHAREEEGVRIFVDGVVGEGAYDRFPADVQQLILDNASEFTVETSSSDFWAPFTCEDAAAVSAETLLLTGDNSAVMFGLIVDQLGRCLPTNTVRRVPQTSHEVTSDNPEAYNAMVLEFLAAGPGGSSGP